jgi:hypothetical protein
MDADMIAYEGLTQQVVDMTVSGKWAFAPIVWSTSGDPEDWYAGAWRAHGTGMIAFFVSGEPAEQIFATPCSESRGRVPTVSG